MPRRSFMMMRCDSTGPASLLMSSGMTKSRPLTMAIAWQMWSPEAPRMPRHVLRLLGQGLIVLTCSILVGVVRVPVPFVMIAALTLGAMLP